jgi:hypothetical protein
LGNFWNYYLVSGTIRGWRIGPAYPFWFSTNKAMKILITTAQKIAYKISKAWYWDGSARYWKRVTMREYYFGTSVDWILYVWCYFNHMLTRDKTRILITFVWKVMFVKYSAICYWCDLLWTNLFRLLDLKHQKPQKIPIILVGKRWSGLIEWWKQLIEGQNIRLTRYDLNLMQIDCWYRRRSS